MADIYLDKLANVIIQYSLEVQPGQVLRCRTFGNDAPIRRAVFREAVKAGANLIYRNIPDELLSALIRYGTEEQIVFIPKTDPFELEYFDAEIAIEAPINTKSGSGLDPAKLAQFDAARESLSDRYMERAAEGKMRWCYTQIPTQALAQDAEMSLEDYEQFVFGAMLLNEPDPVAAWRRVHDNQQRVVDFLTDHDEIHIVAKDTNIKYKTKGRLWKNASGKVNFPDGEVFTGAHENTVNGYVTFTYPVNWRNRNVEGARLEFQDGKCVKATAARGEDYLNAILDMDEGARYVGEVAFGLNYGVQKFTNNLLFDEKIGGTMHMALGASYPETGGVNKSGLHWDMVCDLREGGKVFADGKLCYENGKFLI